MFVHKGFKPSTTKKSTRVPKGEGKAEGMEARMGIWDGREVYAHQRIVKGRSGKYKSKDNFKGICTICQPIY